MDLIFILSALVALETVVAAGATDCPVGYYKKQEKCQICTECPPTQIIRKQCSEYTDNVCGPFKEFHSFFRNKNNVKKSSTGLPPFHFPVIPVDHKDLLRRRKLVKEWANRVHITESTTRAGPTRKFVFRWPPYQKHKADRTMPPTSTKANTVLINTEAAHWSWRLEQWQELCFGLIGGLAAVSAVLIIYIIVSHCRARRAQKAGIYVVDNPSIYQRGRIFSRDRLNTTDYKSNLCHLEEQLAKNKLRKKWMRTSYNPNSSLLDGNHYVDEVFEPNPYQSLETLISAESSLPEVRVIDNPAPPVPDGPRPTFQT